VSAQSKVNIVGQMAIVVDVVATYLAPSM